MRAALATGYADTMSTDAQDSTDDRFKIVRRHVGLQVIETYPGFGSAWAEDQDGHRCMLNHKSEGVDVTELRVGQQLFGDLSRFNYVIAATPQ